MIRKQDPCCRRINATRASSLQGNVAANADGSVDVYFGPTAPKGKENNWIQTAPGKGFFLILRLYAPLKPWFDQTWRLGQIEQYKGQ